MLWDRAAEIWTKAVRSPQRPARNWWRQARRMSRDAEGLRALSDGELRGRAIGLRYRASSGESLDSLMPEAYPLVVEAARRQIGLRHFEVQIVGGIALHHGCIAEIHTGEGKTLIATLPLFLNALRGLPVYLATANDYLAKRDSDWMRPVYESLGLTVAAVTGDLSPAQRREAYACDITYGTAREFGFDFLRDRLALRTTGHSGGPSFAETLIAPSPLGCASRTQSQCVQRQPFHFALIDEADSLLIDEARTPLIISSALSDADETESLLHWASSVAEEMRDPELVALDAENQQRFMTTPGLRRLRSLPKPAAVNDVPLSELSDAVVRAVHVAATLKRDEHYVVQDGQVLIVDEFTGRIADGRKWRNGIHQAVEAREGVPLSPLTHHAARVTVQEFFARFERVSGMTGTGATSSFEFWTVYGLPVIPLPTHHEPQRITLPSRVLPTSEARWDAIADEVLQTHQQGRPVLIGTRTIEQSECLSARLRAAAIEHQVLNARNPAAEASIVADAGRPRCVTVATNMAGRGTDIRLQGDAQPAGGLHVICSEPHSSARIDRQLAGRCGRQGDPGSVRQFMCFDDDILQSAFGAERAAELRDRAKRGSSWDHDEPLFSHAQTRVDRQHQQERRLLVIHSRQQARQLEQLGQDPFLDGV